MIYPHTKILLCISLALCINPVHMQAKNQISPVAFVFKSTNLETENQAAPDTRFSSLNLSVLESENQTTHMHANSALANALILAARKVNPEKVARLIHIHAPSFNSATLRDACACVQETQYVYTGNIVLRPFECFFKKGLFDSKKKACRFLLRKTLKERGAEIESDPELD